MNPWLESFLSLTSQRTTLTTDSAYIFETEASRSLHFNSRWVQSMMRKDAPDALALAYTQKMMAFLLFNPRTRTGCAHRTRWRFARKVLS